MSVTFSAQSARQFNRLIQAEARSWDPSIDLQGEPGTRGAYIAAGQHLRRLILPFLPPEIATRRVAIESGLTVVSSFTYMAAILAAHEGLSQPELYKRARGKDSCAAVQLPAGTTRHLANAIQHHTGLAPASPYDSRTDEEKMREYRSTPHGFAIPNPEYTADSAAYAWDINISTMEEGIPAGKCPAPGLGMVSSSLQAMVTVANNDPRLFAATLAKTIS